MKIIAKRRRSVRTSNYSPVSDAGPYQTVNEGDRVTLDGTGSSDSQWGHPIKLCAGAQTAGPSVMLSNSKCSLTNLYSTLMLIPMTVKSMP